MAVSKQILREAIEGELKANAVAEDGSLPASLTDITDWITQYNEPRLRQARYNLVASTIAVVAGTAFFPLPSTHEKKKGAK